MACTYKFKLSKVNSMKTYTIYLEDDLIDDLFFALESASDDTISHRCDIKAESREKAAEILSSRFRNILFEKYFEES